MIIAERDSAAGSVLRTASFCQQVQRWRAKNGRLILLPAVFAASFIYFAWVASAVAPETVESQDLYFAANFFHGIPIPVDQSPVYYFLLALWMKLGSSLFFLRAPSFAAAAAGVVVIFLLLEAEAGVVGGLLAALFLAANSGVVYCAGAARCYALVIPCAALSLWFVRRYVVDGRRWRDLLGFVVSAVAGFFLHLYFLVFAGSLGLLMLLDWLHRRPTKRELLAALAPLLILTGAAAYQLFKVREVFRYTGGRYVFFKGIAHDPVRFFTGIGNDFFRYGLTATDQTPYVTLAFLLLALSGMIALRRRGIIAGLVILVPTAVASYYLSAGHAIYSRYLVFLLIPLAGFGAAAVARLRRVWLWGPVAVAIMVYGVYTVHRRITPPTDWPQTFAEVRRLAQPGDIVAVFPDYWSHTVRAYLGDVELSPFISPMELDRMTMSGKRVIVLIGPAVRASHIIDDLKTRHDGQVIMVTRVRDRFSVWTSEAKESPPPDLPRVEEPTLLVTGVVSPGWYPWPDDAAADQAFAAAAPLFHAVDQVLVPYAPYAADAPFTPAPTRRFDLIAPLRRAGATMAVVLPKIGAATDPTAAIGRAGIQLLPRNSTWRSAAPLMLNLRGQNVAILRADQRVFTDRPEYRSKRDAVVADWVGAVGRAKQAVGPDGRLVVLLPQAPGYNRLFAGEDQMIARLAVDAGADAVVGVGGWNAEEIEAYKTGVIAYSLGALLRPPSGTAIAQYSTGALLRLRFPPHQPVGFDLLPISFDNTSRLAAAPTDDAAHLRFSQPIDPAEDHLYDHLFDARATARGRDGVEEPIKSWKAPEISFNGVWTRYENAQHRGGEWLGSLLIPSSRGGGFFLPKSWIAVAGNTSVGQFRRALMMRAPPNGKITTTFPAIFIGNELRLTYGLDDEVLVGQPWTGDPVVMNISVAGRSLRDEKIVFKVGWKTISVDTSEFAGRDADIAISATSTEKTNYSISVDAVVVRGPDLVRQLAERPYSFYDHLADAQAYLIDQNGERTSCRGPDETYRLMRGGRKSTEEHGPYGEGCLFRRWVCGDLPWDCVGLTRQKSGGVLRPAIWLHPLTQHQRVLTFARLKIRRMIRGYYGTTDLVARMERRPATFTVRVGDRVMFRDTITGDAGWHEFNIELPPAWFGKPMEVTFITETPNDKWRHVLFNAWMN